MYGCCVMQTLTSAGSIHSCQIKVCGTNTGAAVLFVHTCRHLSQTGTQTILDVQTTETILHLTVTGCCLEAGVCRHTYRELT
jgi:hypothetical protein